MGFKLMKGKKGASAGAENTHHQFDGLDFFSLLYLLTIVENMRRF
jgi:hypothetical protein